MGSQVPSVKRGRSPQFSGDVYSGQMAGWIKMVLDIEVGLGPGDILLDGDQPTLIKKAAEPPPIFRPISIVAKRLDASICHLLQR